MRFTNNKCNVNTLQETLLYTQDNFWEHLMTVNTFPPYPSNEIKAYVNY